MDVPEWTKKDYAEKGDALSLSQDTSRRIARRNLHAECLYIRGGRNFSPDWMERTQTSGAEKWAESVGFKRVRIRPLWGEAMQEYRDNIMREATRPLFRMISEHRNRIGAE